MDVEALSHCIGPLSQDYLARRPHHVLPCTNLHRGLISERLEYSNLLSHPFPYSSKLPIPVTDLLKASRSAINGVDPITNLVREKLIWEMKKERLVKLVRKDKQSISGRLLKKATREPEGGNAVIPQGISMLAQHLDQDPDPYFSGASYWYYTGGTLATLKHSEDQYLLFSDQSSLNFTRVADGVKSGLTKTLILEKKDSIHQILTNKRGAVVRQKSCVSVLSKGESDDETFKLCQVHKITDKRHSFLSVALPEKSLRNFCTLTDNGILKLWDLKHSEKAKTKVQLAPEDGVVVTDSWRQLRYQDNNTVLVVDKCCLHMLDARADMSESQNAWCPKDLTEMCEQVSYVVCSEARPHLVYLATSHQLLGLDLRQGFCKRWTHLMTAPPHLGFTKSTGDNQEMVCLGSQLLSDCNVIINSWGGEQYRPGSVPSPAKSLLLARQHGLCLDPSLTHRCTQNMSGLTFLPVDDSNVHIVRQTSSADVFIQHLTKSQQKNSSQLTQNDLTAFSEWSKPTLSTQREPADINVSGVKDFTEVLKVTAKTQINKEDKEKPLGLEGGSSWRLSKKYLEDCVDLLAGRLLSVWDVEEEEEWAVEVEEAEEEEHDPSQKVLNWLDRAEEDVTGDRRDVTDLSALKPMVASTPFPTSVKPLADESPTEPTPWMTNPGQVLRQSPPYSPSGWGYDEQPWKKQKLCEEISEVTPQKQTLIKKTQRSSTKKKFIPGF